VYRLRYKICRGIQLVVMVGVVVMQAAAFAPAAIGQTSETTMLTHAQPVGVRQQLTVFSQGPELHLLPNVGRVGTRVLAAGIGYRPGGIVHIVYGTPNAGFLPLSVARAIVSRAGTFRTSFVVSCAFVVAGTTQALHPPQHCPLSSAQPFRAVIVGAFVGRNLKQIRTESMGFIVTG